MPSSVLLPPSPPLPGPRPRGSLPNKAMDDDYWLMVGVIPNTRSHSHPIISNCKGGFRNQSRISRSAWLGRIIMRGSSRWGGVRNVRRLRWRGRRRSCSGVWRGRERRRRGGRIGRGRLRGDVGSKDVIGCGGFLLRAFCCVGSDWLMNAGWCGLVNGHILLVEWPTGYIG